MNGIIFSEVCVASLLQKVKINSAPGSDRIPNHILNNCPVSVSPYLVTLFRMSFDQGKLPLDWKYGNVVPICKSGGETITSNYGLISLTCTICKILEHIIYTNLINHLCQAQHGFRAGFSCNTQWVEFTHDIATSMNSGHQLDCIFLDFQKAFDSVLHNLLWQTVYLKNTDSAIEMVRGVSYWPKAMCYAWRSSFIRCGCVIRCPARVNSGSPSLLGVHQWSCRACFQHC